MAGARLTEWEPEALMSMTSAEVVRWIHAQQRAADLIGEWFDLDPDEG